MAGKWRLAAVVAASLIAFTSCSAGAVPDGTTAAMGKPTSRPTKTPTPTPTATTASPTPTPTATTASPTPTPTTASPTPTPTPTATTATPTPTPTPAAPRHHFVSNQGPDLAQQQAALGVGLDWQDFSSNSVMNAAPAGVQGIRWVGNGYNSSCSWAVSDASLTTIVQQNIGNPKFSGIYFISDEPHTALCPDAPTRLAERTALIKSIDPAAKTFTVVLDGANNPGEYQAFKDSADYIGVDPYPCNVNNATTGCDMNALSSRIDSALTWIPANRIVPTFQVFGQACNTGTSHYYRLPTVSELQAMLTIWDAKVPKDVRPFDDSYSWRNQTTSCPTLVDATGGTYPDLQGVLRSYFAS